MLLRHPRSHPTDTLLPYTALVRSDPVTRRPLPAGEVGEVLVRGYCLMKSLNGRERHEVFDAECYYPTGDLCRLDVEGYLKFEARRGEMIKIHGANVADRKNTRLNSSH